MSSRYLKNTVVFSVVTAVILGIFVSCENPFVKDLGEKVDVENPKIWGVDPKSGAFIKDTTSFNGMVSAYRELRANNPVEVRIARPDNTQEGGWKSEEWTANGIVVQYNSKKEAQWSYDLDTTAERDGFLKITFRVHDPNLTTETVELVYIVKNGPSNVKMIMPPEDPAIQLPDMPNDAEIRGQIIDRRGIKPGYPRIKIWNENDPEPDEKGWAVMFLTNIDDTDDWIYTDRTQREVTPLASFAFKLADYNKNPTTGEVTYIKDAEGKYKSFAPGVYNYRIVTSDTYFYDDPAKYPGKTMFYPRDPVLENGEKEIVTWHPPLREGEEETALKKGNFNRVKLNPPGERPQITLEPLATPTQLSQKPNIYMTEDEPQTRKILTGNSARTVFQLRVRTYHPLGIDRAELEWEHPASERHGTLNWDGPGVTGTIEGTSHFTLTAREDLTAANTGNKLFEVPEHNAQPYTLKVIVYSTSNERAERTFTMYISKDAPIVEVQSVKGAATEPTTLDNFYTVNKNIEVGVSYAATGVGMNQEDGRDLVKWFVVEEANAAAFVTDKINVYSNDPNEYNLKFFSDVKDTTDVTALRTAKSGWVADRVLRFNTANFDDGSDLRMFIIAQDRVQNLGYTSIRLKVDQASDKPEVKSPTLTAAGAGINSVNDLFIVVDVNKELTGVRRNTLDKDTGIYLNLNDDDGINVGAGVTITLADKNINGAARRIDVSKIQFSGSSREWVGEITQSVMAAAMRYDDESSYLRDGIYELRITCADDSAAKVSIGANDPQAASVSADPLTFYFCVISGQPTIEMTNPEKNSYVTTAVETIIITGTVTSRIPIQRLWLNFNPVLTPSPVGAEGEVPLFLNANYSTPVTSVTTTGAPDSTGKYTYYWRVPDVQFETTTPPTESEDRSFVLQAADNLGNISPEQFDVKLDKTPPKIELEDFYFSRPLEIGKNEHQVNGKFNFKISAQDNDIIAQTESLVHVKWWILRDDAAVPNWDTPFGSSITAIGGQFSTTDKDASGYYPKIIDSRKLDDKKYFKLYAMAEDRAGNRNAVNSLITFYVDQDSDVPKWSELPQPANNQILSSVNNAGQLNITGMIADDDDFRSSVGTPSPVGHISIRWLTSATGPFNGAWTAIPAGSVSFDSNGALILNYPRTTAQLGADGWKYYQLQVTDVEANKNPDGVTSGPDLITAVTTVFPTGTTAYSFYLKNNKPEIFFAKNDPTSGHPNYNATRPILRDRSALLDALDGGYVSDGYLASVKVSFDRASDEKELIGLSGQNAVTSGRFNWKLAETNIGWLPADSAITEGVHIVTIKAQDAAGNITEIDWQFTKDATGPKVTANIAQGLATTDVRELPVIAGASGVALSITGRFDDDYSAINTSNATYRIDTGTVTPLPSANITNITNNGKTANWSIPLPTTVTDGRHSFTLTVYDAAGNTTAANNITSWYFVVDRGNPTLTEHDAMTVGGYAGATGAAITDETARVFAASNPVANNTIFTLSGTASDSTLNDITVAIRQGSTTNDPVTTLSLKDLATSKLGLPVPPQPAWAAGTVLYSLDTEQRMTVTSAATQGTWNWTLKILGKDLIALKGDTGYGTGVPCYISINAQDLGQHNSGTKHWRFLMDVDTPVIAFSNITDGSTIFDNATGSLITMTGTVNDDNRVKQIEYYLEKWDYAANSGAGAWKYGSSNGNWTGTGVTWTTINPTPPATAWTSSVTWQLTGASFPSGVYGSNIFNDTKGEGKYRLTFRATDMALGAGNVSADTSCVFFVDRDDPKIVWDANALKSFYRNKSDGSIPLTFTVTDSNYIVSVAAAITGTDGRTLTSGEISAGAITLNAATGIYSQTVTLSPKLNGASAWTDGKYTLTLTIKDGAGKEANAGNSREFTVDNTAPSIKINDDPGSGEISTPTTPATVSVKEAITGRTPLRGVFTTTSGSPVSVVAFYVAPNNASGTPSNLSAITTKDTDISKADLASAGWRYTDGTGDATLLAPDGTRLLHMEPGLNNVSMVIPDTRNLMTENYAGTDANVNTVSGGVKFGGKDLDGTEQVNLLRIYFLVMDEAGNRNINIFDYQIYPEGDRPTVTLTSPNEKDPLEKRLLNGTIRIGGTAKDNVRVKNVWFRILKGSLHTPVTTLKIPNWDAFWNVGTGNQLPQTKTDIPGSASQSSSNGGWYMANGGGKPEVSWFANINNEGELDPALDGKEPITIEVFAEDAMYQEDGATILPDKKGLYGRRKPLDAYVVKGAPVFGDERIAKKASVDATAGDWETIQTANLRGRAAYRVTVTHESAIKEITWTPPSAINDGNPINLFNTVDPYNSTTYSNEITRMNAGTGTGIAVKAEPKSVKTGSGQSLAAGKKYLIWKWNSSPPSGLTNVISGFDSFPEGTDWTLATFIPTSAVSTVDLGSIELMEENDGKKFEWVVTVDVHADLIDGGKYKDGYFVGIPPDQTKEYTGWSDIKLRATENSRSVPMYTEETKKLPIDNQPPAAAYTHNPYVAGQAATFGGDAGDKGTVSGLARIVLWFSASRGGDEKSIPWVELKGDGSVDSSKTFTSGTPPTGLPALPAGVDFPSIPAKTVSTQTNYSCIVIEGNDPIGNNTVYGHKLPIGFATTGGELSTSWYVTLDSKLIISGRITAHYVVYDKAGNVSYYSQRLIVMNNVPRIKTITLATDIRGDKGLTTGSNFTGNKTYGGEQRDETASPGDTVSTEPMDTIKSAYPGVTNTLEQGISAPITINTSDVRDFGVVYDQAFNVRNKLLAVKVDIEEDLDTKGRTFRLEYVSGAKALAGYTSGDTVGSGTLKDIKAGRVYIINEPGNLQGNTFPWGSFGAQVKQNEVPKKGAAFLAIANGTDLKIPDVSDAYGRPSVWELNNHIYSTTGTDRKNPNVTKNDYKVSFTGTNLGMSDVVYNNTASTTNGKSAEFVYGASAFDATQFDVNGGTSTSIRDFRPTPATNPADGRPAAYPAFPNANASVPWAAHSLFIVRVFGGDEEELFGDFALLSIRVNNNDRTQPYAQLYDLNPKTEGQDNPLTGDDAAAQQLTALSISEIGANRTKGGLWNTGTVKKIAKSGHIEPRTTTNLTSGQMGGALTSTSATITKPFLDEEKKASNLFAVDTVSGDVILRGYVEDDQRITGVRLYFYDNTGTALTNVDILQSKPNPTNTGNFGLQKVTTEASRVAFTETVDLYRHRVEWAYLWRTETVPGGNNVVANNINVYAVAYNANAALAQKTDMPSGERTFANAGNTTYDYYNPGYPATASNSTGVVVRRYNRIPVNLRPYITGFKRNQSTFAHDTRSRQGWYMFARGEIAVATGFNLLNGNNTTNSVINLPGMGDFTTVNVLTNIDGIANTNNDFGISTTNNARYRKFRVNANTTGNNLAATGNGLITLTVNSLPAVNTGSERARATPATPVRPLSIQAWNIERSPGTDGSELWDDFTQAHIWQSNDTAPSAASNTATNGSGRFASTDNWSILSPAMSINPTNGDLYESHNEGGSGNTYNTGTTRRSAITDANVQVAVTQFVDPIMFSDVYRSPGYAPTGGTAIGAETWVVSSIIGRSGTIQSWLGLGGIYIHGAGGSRIAFYGGGDGQSTTGTANSRNTTLYHGESTWYNASTASASEANPPGTDQFMNPHIITSYNGTGTNTREHIHVSYYDDLTGSIKYRYNRRGYPGTITPNDADNTNTDTVTAINGIPKMWTNLDGGLDSDDTIATTYTNADINTGTIALGARVVRYTAGATSNVNYTLVEANKGNAIATAANTYLRERAANVTANSYVNKGDYLFTVGAQARGTNTNTTAIYAPASGTISGNALNTIPANGNFNTNLGTGTAFTINNTNTNSSITSTQATRGRIRAGKHNAIAVTSQGFPVIAYYDETNQRLKLAVSGSVAPVLATDWVIRDYVIPSGNLSSFGTGEFVSMKIDTTNNKVHIAAMNTNKRLVYVSGTINTFTAGSGNTQQTSGGVFTLDKVQVVDSVGNVGRWCSISLDSNGNPWISYMDESYVGSRDGAKVAYLNTTTFYKGGSSHFSGGYIDLYGESLAGWETMHVPTTYRVENPVEGPGREHGRLKIECFPTRNAAAGTNNTKFWSAAVGYLSQDAEGTGRAMDRYRVAYYVK